MVARITKAVFPAGGLGTRFLPATKALPKEMLPVLDRPLIQYAVDEASASGVESFFFVTASGKTAIVDYFDSAGELEGLLEKRGNTEALSTVRDVLPKGGRVSSTRQFAPLGLGHAVWCAARMVGDEPFGIILADDLVFSDTPCLAQLAEIHAKVGGNVVAVQEVPAEHTNRYGILDVTEDNGRIVRARGIVEKPNPADAPSNLAVIGRYILQPGIFACLDKHERGAGGEIQLTDAIAAMIETEPLHGVRFEGRRFDCGDKLGFFEATVATALEREDMRDAASGIIARYAKDL